MQAGLQKTTADAVRAIAQQPWRVTSPKETALPRDLTLAIVGSFPVFVLKKKCVRKIEAKRIVEMVVVW